MNYQKVDATLALTVDESKSPKEPRLAVYIYTDNSRDEAATIFLNGLGIRVYSKNQDTFTATVSPQTVKELSQQPWVRHVKLSPRQHVIN